MKKIIVFFNSEPAMVVPVMTGVNTIMREYPNGETTHLTVMVDWPPESPDNQYHLNK
ncbi:hypothetical protein KTO00_12705 [Escherichia coli]|nr:hypothetical protein [Escherichia coli]MBV0741207.1 hypothetical protein [Escherichia coli]